MIWPSLNLPLVFVAVLRRHAAEAEASKATKVASAGNSKAAAANKVLEGQVAELKKKVKLLKC